MTLTTLLIVLVVGVLIFLALREVNCWYWKINRQISLQEETNYLLEKLLKQTSRTEADTVNQTTKKDKKIIDPSILSSEVTDLNDPKVMEAIKNKYGNQD